MAPTVYTAPRVNVPDAPAKLRKFESGFRTRWSILFILGIVVMFIGPAIFAGILRAVEIAHPRERQHPWLYLFFVCSLVMIPIALILGRFVRGNLTDRAAEGAGSTYGNIRFVSYGAGRAMIGVLFIDICLWGPRMVFGGLNRILALSSHAKADRAVAARILGILMTFPEGIPLGQLMTQTAAPTVDAFSDALALLAYLDIIDISADGSRAWLQSLARDRLGRL